MPDRVRSERLASSIQRLLQEAIARGLNDPRIRGLVTVTRVEMVDEGRTARAYVSVLPEERAELTMHGLRDATSHLRRGVMGKIRVRYMPRLEIHYDAQLKRQSAVLQAIAKAERERASADTDGVTTDPPSLPDTPDAPVGPVGPSADGGSAGGAGSADGESTEAQRGGE